MKTERYRIGDKEYDVAVNSCTDGFAEVTVNGVTYRVDILKNTISPEQDDQASASATLSHTDISSGLKSADNSAPVLTGGRAVASPLPGVIVAVKVKPGDKVKSGQVVAVLEAMKMENEIQSEYDGTVTSVNVSQGDSVLEGAAIVTIG